MNVIRAAMPRLRAQRGGHVFNVSSILGFDGAAEGWARTARPSSRWAA